MQMGPAMGRGETRRNETRHLHAPHTPRHLQCVTRIVFFFMLPFRLIRRHIAGPSRVLTWPRPRRRSTI